MNSLEKIAIIGGTGHLGSAIAWRSAQGAQDKAQELGHGLTGASNAEAAQGADIIIVTVPMAAQETTLLDIKPHVAGKIVVETTVPLVPPKVMRVSLPPEGSAAIRAAGLLGEGVRLTSAFHNVAAHRLALDEAVDCDVLVFGDDKAAREAVIDLATAMDLRGLHGGALVNSAAAEAMTSLLIFINKTYQADGAGLRITGLPVGAGA